MSEINIQIGTTSNSFREIWMTRHKIELSKMTFTLLVSIMGSQTVDIRLEIKG